MGYVYTIPDSLSCRLENYSAWCERNWPRSGKSHSHSPTDHTGAVGQRGRGAENTIYTRTAVYFRAFSTWRLPRIFPLIFFFYVRLFTSLIQKCKFRKALEIVEIQRNALCKSKATIFAPSSNPQSWIFTSISVGSNPCSYSFTSIPYSSNTCSHCYKEWHRNLTNRWRFTFKTDVAQLLSVTEAAPKSAFYV